MSVRWIVLAVVGAALLGGGVGAGATLFYAERGPAGEQGPRGPTGPRGPEGESASDLASDLEGLESRIEEMAGRTDEISSSVSEDLDTLADQIEEAQQLVVDNCAELGGPIYKCSLGGFTLNSPP